MPPPPQPDYATPATESARPKRPFRAWIILLLTWTLGLIVWAVYIAAFVFLLFKFLV